MKIITCEDNRQEQQIYTEYLHALGEKHSVRIELTVYNSANVLLSEAQKADISADLIYMDINMPGITGAEAAIKLRELGYQNDIVFLTASKEHFRGAFDVQALHYIVKGETSMAEFEKIFLRALLAKGERNQKYVVYCGGGETRNIPLDSIQYYETRRGIVTVHYDKDKSFEFPQENLQEIENDLEGYGFFRNYRSCLVALSAIESIVYNEITLHNGKKLPLSRHKYAELKALIRPGKGKTVK